MPAFRTTFISAAVLVTVSVAATGYAQTLNKCSSKKKLCVAKKMAALLKCHNKAEKSGLPVDPVCTQEAVVKFDGGANPAKGCFEKLENKQDPMKPESLCLTQNDTAAAEAKVDAFVLDVVTEVDPAFPAPVFNTCSAGKKKCVSKKAKALLKCHAKAEKKGLPLDPLCVQKAHDKFDGGADPAKGCFEKLESQQDAGAPETVCPTLDDTAALEAKVDAFVNDVVSELDPAFPTPTPTPPPTVTASCTAGPTDVPTPTPTPPYLIDNGDGTVTDNLTGLQWEKKTGTVGTLVDCTPNPPALCPDPHDVNNAYHWCNGTFPTCVNPSNPPDGEAFTVFLAALNTAVFAGHTDWRLPTFTELQTLIDLSACGSGACIDPIFGSIPSTASTYWSSTTDPGDSNVANAVRFDGPVLGGGTKSNRAYVRAVRGNMPCP